MNDLNPPRIHTTTTKQIQAKACALIIWNIILSVWYMAAMYQTDSTVFHIISAGLARLTLSLIAAEDNPVCSLLSVIYRVAIIMREIHSFRAGGLSWSEIWKILIYTDW